MCSFKWLGKANLTYPMPDCTPGPFCGVCSPWAAAPDVGVVALPDSRLIEPPEELIFTA